MFSILRYVQDAAMFVYSEVWTAVVVRLTANWGCDVR